MATQFSPNLTSSYLTHSVFTIIFPAHLLLLRLFRPNVSIKVYLRNIRKVTAEQVRHPLFHKCTTN